jgi:hypothetical protein
MSERDSVDESMEEVDPLDASPRRHNRPPHNNTSGNGSDSNSIISVDGAIISER